MIGLIYYELERIWKEIIMALRYQHFPEGTVKNHEKLQPGWPVSWLRFKPGTSQI
jgi:hypothetical protein